MAQENVLINFEVNYDQLTNAQEQLAKAGKIDSKGFQAIQQGIDETAKDTQGLIKQFKEVATASIKMGKSVESAFEKGVQDALKDAGVTVNQFSDALKKANVPAITLKKELQQLKESMARMKAEGKDTGKEFDALRARAGKLSDAIADANAEIKNAGSDTRGIDNVVGSISALAGGYSALQGATALFGDESEDLQKTLIKVNGAMALATGIQQVFNAVQKEGSLAKLADTIATGSQTAAMTLYTFVTSGATVAARIFKATLLATGIGAVVVLIVALVNAMSDYSDETKDATESMDSFNDRLALQNELFDQNLNRLNLANKLLIEKAKQRGASEVEINKIVIQGLKDQAAALRSLASDQQKQFDDALASGKLSGEALLKLNDELTANKIKANDIDREITLKTEQFKTEKIIEFAKKRKAELERLQKEAEAGRIEADKNFILGAIAKANKEIEQEQIAFDNLQDIEAQKREEYEKTLDAKKKALAEGLAAAVDAGVQESAEVKKTEEEKRAEYIKTANAVIELASKIGSLFGQLSAIQTERDQQLVASKRKETEELLKAGAISQKAAEARQKQIDAFEKKARREAAEREKKAALFQAVLAIPQAFLKGLTSAPPPYGAILGGIAAALAAAEAAIIASKPIPRFFRGKKDRYEGPGEVADMGSEIVERGGRMFLYTKPTQTYLGANDKVYTAAETRQIMHNTNISTTVTKPAAERFDYDRFAKAIPAAGININIDKDGITEWTETRLARTQYMDRRYSSKR